MFYKEIWYLEKKQAKVKFINWLFSIAKYVSWASDGLHFLVISLPYQR